MTNFDGKGLGRLVSLLLIAVSSAGAQEAAETVSFNRDIRPILSDNCFACHGFDSKHREAGLRLDTFDGATAEHDGVTAIAPGDPDNSELWFRIDTDDSELLMPPKKSRKPPLTVEQRAKFKLWIEQGAKYAEHWAFTPPARPATEGAEGPAALDFFITRKLAEAGLTPSPEASPETLIRRASLDLIGLPPTIAEIDAFTAASAKDADAAYRELVDRLLENPHYGERWGRWWLDQARYADSNGYSIDAPRQIWKYRDWVVDALNADMPFDAFTVEQLAGDLLPDADQSQNIATGFHRNTQINQEGGIDVEQFRVDSVFDRVATTGSVWLGLSIGCAQCHDHKFDPVTQKEYYQFFAFLNNQDEPSMKVYDPDVNVQDLTAEFKELGVQLTSFLDERKDELETWEAGLTPAIKKSLTPEVNKILAAPKAKRNFAQRRALYASGAGAVGPFRQWNDRYNELDAILNQGVTTLVMKERATPRKSTVLIKGDFTRPSEEVEPGTPAVLHSLDHPKDRRANRLDLANWIVDPRNPLTARVIMNRVWQQYFGRGIVESENDFGMQGSPPSHPELLDWLAVEFMERKWSLKAMHRLIATSRAYRRSSTDTPELHEKDPADYLLARQQRLRLDAEVVRDVALAASGLLSPKLGGPPVYPPIPDGVMSQGQVKRVWAVSKGEDRYRRGLYTFVYRGSPPPSLNVFDAPDGVTTCTRRVRSNTPLQSLTLLNDAGFFEFASALEKIIKDEGLETAFRRCTTRRPNPEELSVLRELDALSAARVLLNLDEPLTRE